MHHVVVFVTEFVSDIFLDFLQGNSSVPQHEILLSGTFVPVDTVWCSSAVRDKKLGGVYGMEIFHGSEPDALDTLVYAVSLDLAAERPIDFILRVVFQQIFCKCPWIATVLFKEIGPEKYPALLYRAEETYE